MGKNNKKGKAGNGYKKKFHMRGQIEELGSHVYTYGAKGSGERYTKTTEYIAAYLGREHGKKAQRLIEGVESPPKEPKQPRETKESSEFSFAAIKYKKQLDHYYDRLEKWELIKGIAFIVVMGKCTLAMKNKVESEGDYKTWKEEDDVTKLLRAIKDLSYAKTSIQNPYWGMVQDTKRVHVCHQGPEESLAGYYKKFATTVEVLEDRWGMYVPTKLVLDSGETAEVVRKKFQACMFIAGADKKRYGKVADELNNQFLSGQDNYPKNVEAAMNMLSHRMDSDNKTKDKDDHDDDVSEVSEDGTHATSFSQTSSSSRKSKKHVTCNICGGKGHYATECPSKGYDSDSSTGTGWNGLQLAAKAAFAGDG